VDRAGADELVFSQDDDLDHTQLPFARGDYQVSCAAALLDSCLWLFWPRCGAFDQIWYGEDLGDRSEQDNAGETCVDVR